MAMDDLHRRIPGPILKGLLILHGADKLSEERSATASSMAAAETVPAM